MGKHILSALLLLLQLAAVAAEDANSSLLRLSPGLHLSMPPSYNLTSGFPISSDLIFTVATPTLDEDGIFFPILSSPSFNSSSSSSSSNHSPPSSTIISNSSQHFGFSLGFYIVPNFVSSTDSFQRLLPCASYGCNIYMAVCVGFSGSMDESNADKLNLSGAIYNKSNLISPFKTVDGFAAPVWIANLESPIRYVDQASLTVEVVADSKAHNSTMSELQLWEGENVVWQVRDVNIMEMRQDTGRLHIYNSSNRSHLVWQSSPTDSLVQGQSLSVGQQLVSNDSSYVARMEKGGLVFYMNKTHFNREPQPPPYWLLPVYIRTSYVPRSPGRDDPKSLNSLISTAPCSNSPSHAEASLHPTNGIDRTLIGLHPGLCSSLSGSFLISSLPDSVHASWMFWKLESDGMLYSYGVSRSSSSNGSTSVVKRPVNSVWFTDNNTKGPYYVFKPLFLEWQECNVPMACGPLGVCTPGAKPFCSCSPEQDFEPVNTSNIFQGCRRRVALPNCTVGIGHGVGSTDFVQLDSTASILLFNEWTFSSPPAMDVNACKQSCSSDCSCNGFFYQKNTSSCFFISDEISLMQVADTNYTSITDPMSWTKDGGAPAIMHEVSARNYVTFLKVTSSIEGGGKKIINRATLVALSAIIPSMVLCVVLGLIGYLFRARRKKLYGPTSILSKEESEELQDILPLLPYRFSYKDLFEATEGFKTLLGAGGCGSVYAGVLPDGRKVAVKVLQVVVQGTKHSKQFLAEIATIGRTGHHNIVRLVGFCCEVWQRLLVYEYVERGSLDRWLFVREPEAPVDDISATVAYRFLDWKTHYNVALGIARGLSYLHEDCEQPILHFDIKPQNILLDDEFVAKLADFGMSKLMERDMSEVVTGMRGTPGYIAPEWSLQGTVSKKSDVYSMGMVLLEIVGGRRNLDFALLNSSSDVEERDAWHFPSWAARKCEQGQMMEVVDRRVLQYGSCTGFDEEQAVRLIHIAFWCIQEDPAMRPNAPKVVQWLEGSSVVEQPPYSMGLRAGKRPNKLAPISFS